jgi:hypothetical protein
MNEMELYNRLPTDIQQQIRNVLIFERESKFERATAHIRSKPYIQHLNNLISLHRIYTEIGSDFVPALLIYPWKEFLFADGWLEDQDDFVFWCLATSYHNDFQTIDQWNDWHENVAYSGIPTLSLEPPFLI